MHQEGWDPPNQPKPPQHICLRIISCSLDNYECGESTINMNTQPNMCMFGKNYIMILTMGKTVDVNTFAAEVSGSNESPTVDVFFAYNCPRSKGCFFLWHKISCMLNQ